MIRLKWSFLLFLCLQLMAGCALSSAGTGRNKSAPALPAGTIGGTEVRALFFNQTVKSQIQGQEKWQNPTVGHLPLLPAWQPARAIATGCS